MNDAERNPDPTPADGHLGLGLDAGGTQTRWAVADALGHVQAEGIVAPISGLQLGKDEGRAAVRLTLDSIADELRQRHTPALRGAVAGITGLDLAQWPVLCELVGTSLGLERDSVQAMSDIELACRAAYAPGEGLVVYAGTGSIAAFFDRSGTLQRAGGRGSVIDDAGGGHWIAREALRLIWRAEDEEPGAWQRSRMAVRVFEQIGGSDWPRTRQWVYGATRGELGLLALAVAGAAEEDAAALAILQGAGSELARLARALLRRHGLRSVGLAGRVFELHPCIESALRVGLPEAVAVQRLALPAHHAAARLAAQHEPVMTTR